MRKLITISLISLIFSSNAQVIHRVNADPTVQGVNVYRDLQEAYDNARDGDFIYLEPNSVRNYYSVGSIKKN